MSADATHNPVLTSRTTEENMGATRAAAVVSLQHSAFDT